MKFVIIAAVAALAAMCTAPAASAQDQAAAAAPGAARKSDSSDCPEPAYPVRAHRAFKQGIVEAGFLVRPDGTTEDSFVATSSGVPDLDRATLESMAKCRFTPATVNGKPVARWIPLVYQWRLTSTSAEPEFIKKLEQGSPAGQYLLALMYSNGFMVNKDEAAGQRWLQMAAGRGVPMAQFRLGEAYEEGNGVPQDDAQALFWYRKAAAQRNTFAREKLHFGFGSVDAAPET